MKAASVLLTLPLVLLGHTLFAGSEHIIKQRAKDLRDQNNARQGVAPANPAKPAAVPTAQPAPVYVPAAPTPATPQQQRVGRLQNALASFTPASQSTPQARQQLARDLTSVVVGAKPSAGTSGKVSEALAAALHEKLLSTATRKRLVQNLEGILNPGTATQARVNALISDISALFTANGVSKDKVTTLDSALKALSAERTKT